MLRLGSESLNKNTSVNILSVILLVLDSVNYEKIISRFFFLDAEFFQNIRNISSEFNNPLIMGLCVIDWNLCPCLNNS